MILDIRQQFLRGELTFSRAKDKVLALLEEMNAKGEKIAKKFGRKYKKITFTTVFR